MRTRAIAAIIMISTLRSSVTAVLGSSATAFAKCTITRPSDFVNERFAGWVRSGGGTTPGGVYAQIYNYSPWVSGPADDTTSAWTMLDDGPSWVQVGWIEFPGTDRRTFVQVLSPNEFYNNMNLSA